MISEDISVWEMTSLRLNARSEEGRLIECVCQKPDSCAVGGRLSFNPLRLDAPLITGSLAHFPLAKWTVAPNGMTPVRLCGV